MGDSKTKVSTGTVLRLDTVCVMFSPARACCSAAACTIPVPLFLLLSVVVDILAVVVAAGSDDSFIFPAAAQVATVKVS